MAKMQEKWRSKNREVWWVSMHEKEESFCLSYLQGPFVHG